MSLTSARQHVGRFQGLLYLLAYMCKHGTCLASGLARWAVVFGIKGLGVRFERLGFRGTNWPVDMVWILGNGVWAMTDLLTLCVRQSRDHIACVAGCLLPSSSSSLV